MSYPTASFFFDCLRLGVGGCWFSPLTLSSLHSIPFPLLLQGKLKQAQAQEAAEKLLANRFNPPLASSSGDSSAAAAAAPAAAVSPASVSSSSSSSDSTPPVIRGRGPVGRMKERDAASALAASVSSASSASAAAAASGGGAMSDSERQARLMLAQWMHKMRAKLPEHERSVADQALKEVIPDLAL